MSPSLDSLATYLLLAKEMWHRLRLMDRDRLLVLAAYDASELHLERIALYCRHVILEHNPGHMLKRYDNLTDAARDPDFQFFLKQVKRRFPPERAESMLEDIGVSGQPQKREAFDSDEAYLAQLIGIEPSWLQEHFSAEG